MPISSMYNILNSFLHVYGKITWLFYFSILSQFWSGLQGVLPSLPE